MEMLKADRDSRSIKSIFIEKVIPALISREE